MLLTQEEIDRAFRVVTNMEGSEVMGLGRGFRIKRDHVSIELWWSPRFDIPTPTTITLTISGSHINRGDDGPWWDFVRQEVDKMEAECLRKHNLKVLEREKELEAIAKKFSVDPGPPPAVPVDTEPPPAVTEPQPYKGQSHWDKLMIRLGLRKEK